MTKNNQGILYVLANSVIWGFFPIAAKTGMVNLPPIVALSCATFLSVIFFAFVITWKREWRSLYNKELLKYSMFVVLFIGVFYYGLYYLGLKITTPGNATMVAQFEALSSFLLFQVWKKEEMTKPHLMGTVVLLFGVLIILSESFIGFKVGDFLILLGACIVPFGNLFQQKARRIAPASSVMLLRSLLSVPFLILLSLCLGEKFDLAVIQSSWKGLLFVGVFAFGLSKLFWLEGIHLISVTKSIVIASTSAVFTIIYLAILGTTPNLRQLVALPFILIGVWLITLKEKNQVVL